MVTPSSSASADHMQPQMRFERIKVTITVQELESPLDDECRNKTVYGLAYRDPLAVQHPLVLSALPGDLSPTDGVDREPEQRIPSSSKGLTALVALKYVTEHDVADGDRRRSQGSVPEIGLPGDLATELVDPDG